MRYRHDRPSWLLRAGAFAGLAFMHVPVLIIILYAFTTDDRTYRFPPPGLTLHWFEVAFTRSDIWQSLTLSLIVAACAGNRFIRTSRAAVAVAALSEPVAPGIAPQ